MKYIHRGKTAFIKIMGVPFPVKRFKNAEQAKVWANQRSK